MRMRETHAPVLRSEIHAQDLMYLCGDDDDDDNIIIIMTHSGFTVCRCCSECFPCITTLCNEGTETQIT